MAAITGIDGLVIPGLEIKTVKILENISNTRKYRTAVTSEAMNVAAGVGTQVYRKTQMLQFQKASADGKTLQSLDPSADYVKIDVNKVSGLIVPLPVYDTARLGEGNGAAITSQWQERIGQGASYYLDGAMFKYIMEEDIAGDTTRIIWINDNEGNWSNYGATWTRAKRVEEALNFIDRLIYRKALMARSRTVDYFGINEPNMVISAIIDNKLSGMFSTSYVALTNAPSPFEIFMNGLGEEYMLGQMKCREHIIFDQDYSTSSLTDKTNPFGDITFNAKNVLGHVTHVEKYAQPVLMMETIPWRLSTNPAIPTITSTMMYGIGTIRPDKNLGLQIVRTKQDGTQATWDSTNKKWTLPA